MKAEPKTQTSTVLGGPCLVAAAASAVTQHRLVEAIAIKAVEGQISVATLGRVVEPGIAGQIQQSLAKVQPNSVGQLCRLLQAEAGCARCEHSLDPVLKQGLTVTQSGGAVTVARVRCPGELQVETVESFPPRQEAEIAQLAFSIERLSTHPLARAITRHGKQPTLVPVEFDRSASVPGLGIQADLGERKIFLGRREWLAAVLPHDARWAGLTASVTAAPPGLSEVWVGDGGLLGRLLLRDDLRPQAGPVLETLRKLGLHCVVLTGDRPASAQALQRKIGLSDVRAELKPEEKVAAIRGFMAEGKRVAMIGDGVNDAPSLAVAHVGVAMGARGADAALEQAEIVLMHDRLENFVAAFRLSQNARRVIRQNLFVSLGTVAVLVGFAVCGKIPLTVGVIGHEGSTVSTGTTAESRGWERYLTSAVYPK
jgi:soluble P-type ATPase